MQTQKRNQILPTWVIKTLCGLFLALVAWLILNGQISNLSWWGF